jgi:Amt family ammonium transporter
VITWLLWDMFLSKQKKPTFLGAINGMLCGLVAITPSAGWVNGTGAIFVGLISSSIVWFAWNYLSKCRPFSKVDDALGVVYTHGFAGLIGGLLVGILADPQHDGVRGLGKALQGPRRNFSSTAGSTATRSTNSGNSSWRPVWIICWTAFATAVIFYLVKWILGGLRESDETLRIGDIAIHDEEAYPEPTFGEPLDSPSHLHPDNV